MGGVPVSFGYWVRRRRLALDLTRDALARRVGCSPSAVKRIERDERRPSRTMAHRLADALELPPDQRERFVTAALGEISAERLIGTAPWTEFGRVPPWLIRPHAVEPGRVVGRERELGWLQAHLSAALGGNGRVVFVTGEAGTGKTALLTAFADRACIAVPELVAARGAGTSVGGLGDPYFPIRDAFRMLIADAHAPLQVDQLTRQQAQRLSEFASTVAQVIVDRGPRLLDELVPAQTVTERLGIGVVAPALADAARSDVSDDVDAVVRALAERRPLLVMLDDMQWSDSASAELVFHLTRTLADARVLAVCAYRGSEVAGVSAGSAGVLRKAVMESSRDIGECVLDLDSIDSASARALCDALLDQEAPGLDESVHGELYRRTHGHPLLVLELVRDLKARGDLVPGEGGSWLPGPGVTWDHVPARVAAVIEHRLDCLDADERALLTAAAVEGEYFTVEVAARVAGIDVWDAHRLLTERLGRSHGLVREDTVRRVGSRRLTRYRFGHALFQGFVYDHLGEGARMHAHGLVAAELEELHADNVESVVPLLAHHYSRAGDVDRAVPYLIQTGDRARLLQARDEAVIAYGRAVDLLRERGDTERLAGALMRIGLTHQTAFDHQNAQRAFDEAFALWPASDSSGSRHASGSTTLRLVSAEPESFDPQLAGEWPALSSLLFSGLLRYDEGAQLVPDVAQRWEISGDGRRYTFRLCEDVTWNDGVPVTARDFAYAYRRALDPATRSEASVLLTPVAGAPDVQAGSAPAEEAGIHAVDDRTLVIELAEPTSYFMYNLAHVTLAPLPQHVLNVHGRNWWRPETIVSNGPFQMAAWEPGRSLALERNPRYHGPVSGNVQRLSLKFTGPWDPEHERLYHDDEVDVLAFSLSTGLNVIDRLRRLFPHEHASRDGSFATSSYWVDPEAPPLDDRRLRQAMAMAIDRAALANNWYLDVAATGGLVPPGIPGHVPGIAAPYDSDRATAIVADVLGPDAPPLTFIGMKAAESLIRHLVDQWQAIGLTMEVRLFEKASDRWKAWREAPGAKVSLSGWSADYPDPDTFLRVAVNDYLPHWRHNRYKSTLQKASRVSDPARRLEIYREAEQILVDEAVLVPLVYQAEHLMIKPWVTRFPIVPSYFYLGFLKDVIIGPDERGRVKALER